MRLCCTNRFVTAAETSKLWPTTKFAPYGVPGLQSWLNQAFVHGNEESRAVLTGRNWFGPGSVSSVHDSAVLALLPIVVFVTVFVLGSKSHGERDARLPTTRVNTTDRKST